jgi:hypothetical protein
MMSVYRELTNEERDTAELDAHLEECADCRQVLASYTQVSDQLRSAPVFAPPQDMHAKLMKALADEQLKFLQKSAPGSVATPEFLKPYLQERARETQCEDDIAAFSTAETGPLPLIPPRRKRRPARLRVNQLGVFGLTAAALLVLMLGGLTSLLMLERGNPTSPAISHINNSVNRPTEVNQKIYTTLTLYPNVTSALPIDNEVYYTAYGSGVNSGNWMLMQFDRGTQTNKPLLDTPSSDPLIVLSVSHNWLVWLQYSAPQTAVHLHLPPSDYYTSPRSWSLHFLSLLPAAQNVGGTQNQLSSTGNGHKTSSTGANQPLVNDPDLVDMPTVYLLDEDVFDSATAPSWVNSPIEGSWLVGDTDTLLVTQIDQKGISHLDSYQLSQSGKTVRPQEIASAPSGHVLAWPSATSTGMQIYWADEWIADNGALQSNIWQQQTSEQALRTHGQQEEVSTSTQQVFQNDGMSFQPQVVDNTLFYLSTSEIQVEGQGVVAPNGTPFPTRATDSTVQFTPRTDTGVYAAPPDATVHGTLLMVPLDGPTVGVASMLGTVGQSTGYQAGSTYVVWQDSTGYQMYDVERQSDVVMGATLNSASLLVVNGSTTLWLSGSQTDSRLRLMAFTWPN